MAPYRIPAENLHNGVESQCQNERGQFFFVSEEDEEKIHMGMFDHTTIPIHTEVYSPLIVLESFQEVTLNGIPIRFHYVYMYTCHEGRSKVIMGSAETRNWTLKPYTVMKNRSGVNIHRS